MPSPVEYGAVARTLSKLPQEALYVVVSGRLLEKPSFILPRLGAYDPSGIFIGSFKEDSQIPFLKPVVARLVDEWRQTEFAELAKRPEPLGEALFLASMIGAAEAIPPVSEVAKDDRFVEIRLAYGEDLQSRALRSLAGLLVSEPEENRNKYRDIFEKALGTEVHAPIGLTTLVGLWPEEESRFVDRARLHNSPRIERVIEILGPISKTFRS